jgi:hypothetical protein
LYLLPLDRALAGAFMYARFGDDILVVEAELARAEAAARSLAQCCSELELRFNPDKTRNLYFTTPGCPLRTPSELAFAPASHIEYLGVRISFDGHLGLKRKRLRDLLRRTRMRAQNTFALAPGQQATQWVARAVANALFHASSSGDPMHLPLSTWVDDRRQLRELDFSIALLCAEVLSERRGIRALRHTRSRQLRAAGLPSLLELRRRGAGRA